MADDISWGNFKELEKAQEVESGTGWSIAGIGDTASSWLDTLANTATKYNDVASAFGGATTAQQNATQQQYAKIQDGATASNSSMIAGIDKNYLVYGGIGLVVLILVMKGD